MTEKRPDEQEAGSDSDREPGVEPIPHEHEELEEAATSPPRRKADEDD
jgi:hypothetical protein